MVPMSLNNSYVFITISALLHLLDLLSLHESMDHPPFMDILHDECKEDVTEKYSSAKYTMRTKKLLRNFQR